MTATEIIREIDALPPADLGRRDAPRQGARRGSPVATGGARRAARPVCRSDRPGRGRAAESGDYPRLLRPPLTAPKVLRARLPDAVFQHLLTRARERQFSTTHFITFAAWLDTNPEVPEGDWFKRFPGMTVCGERELVEDAPTSGASAPRAGSGLMRSVAPWARGDLGDFGEGRSPSAVLIANACVSASRISLKKGGLLSRFSFVAWQLPAE